MAATKTVNSFAQKKLFIKIPTQIWDEQVASSYHLSPIRIPTFLWNSQTSPTSSPYHTPNDIAKRSQLVYLNASTPVLSSKKEETTWPATRCKTPLYRFNANHARDEMRLETPCLQSTCKSCAKWHPQLIQEPVWPVERPAVEPLSPIIDPRLLKPWIGVMNEERRTSDVSVLELPDRFVQPVYACTRQDTDGDEEPSLQLQLPIGQKYALFLPSKLVDRTISRPVSAISLWKTSPRQRYTAILPFRTRAGQHRFAERVVKMRIREAKEMVRGILKAGGGNILGTRGAVIGTGGYVGGEARAKKVRFRHRVKLVFGSVEGRRQFGKAVGGEDRRVGG